ncbi:hypothetical protein [Kitasatospora sp. GP82]|uniref:hypothetical protein n=1 Tax=Kitasatospora sp. GP82 TaxID=3035089 RepID=UPI002474B5A4|nr:hypothetical protein [Kitasatospora sp. GP82]MDH6124717.1 hypothetical protein [Kitasatospora sp. GP82]
MSDQLRYAAGAKTVRRIHNVLSGALGSALPKLIPVEVSANVRHHSPGCTMASYGHSRKGGARRLAASGAGRLGLSALV